jgi:eukaryotic-like serine/threonine-protein kinase
MSDFLSNFTNDKYKKTVADHQDVASDVETTVSEVDTSSFEQTASETFEATTEVGNELSENEIDSNSESTSTNLTTSTHEEDDLLVKDQSFAKKQKMKRGIIACVSILAVIGISWFYYGQTHIKVPDFIGKSVSTAQTWADEHKVKLDVSRVYNFDEKVNQVIKATDKNRTISKKKRLN